MPAAGNNRDAGRQLFTPGWTAIAIYGHLAQYGIAAGARKHY